MMRGTVRYVTFSEAMQYQQEKLKKYVKCNTPHEWFTDDPDPQSKKEVKVDDIRPSSQTTTQ